MGAGFSFYFWREHTAPAILPSQNTNSEVNLYASVDSPNTLQLSSPRYEEALKAMAVAKKLMFPVHVKSVHQCQNVNGEVLYKFNLQGCSYLTQWSYVNEQQEPLTAEWVQANQAGITCTSDMQVAMRRALDLGFYDGFALIAEDTDTLYTGTNQHQLIALRKIDGTVKWKADFDYPLGKSIKQNNGFVYVSIKKSAAPGARGNEIVKVDAKTGAVVWTAPDIYTWRNGPNWKIREDGIIVVKDNQGDYALQVSDGKRMPTIPKDNSAEENYKLVFLNETLQIQKKDNSAVVSNLQVSSLPVGTYSGTVNKVAHDDLYWNGKQFTYTEKTEIVSYNADGKFLWRAPNQQQNRNEPAWPKYADGNRLLYDYGGEPGTYVMQIRKVPENSVLWQVNGNFSLKDLSLKDYGPAAIFNSDNYYFIEDLTEWLNTKNGKIIATSPFNVSMRARKATDGSVIWSKQIGYPYSGFSDGVCVED